MVGRLLALTALVCVGCSAAKFAPVSGKVTLNGKALPNATVTFQPEGKEPGPGSIGTTDAEGKYVLKMATGEAAGAVVGKHKVSITAGGDAGSDSSAPPTPGKAPNSPPPLPEEYNAKTKLTFDVPAGGTTTANFDLTSPAK